MSGGHWDYCGNRIRDALESIATDERMRERFPRLAAVLGDLGEAVYEMEHDIDWDFSGDSFIKDDAAFESAALGRLEAALLMQHLTESPEAK